MMAFFPHAIGFTPDILQSCQDMTVSGEKGVNFKTNAALFAIFCPVFKELVATNPGYLDHEDIIIIIDYLTQRDIRLLELFLHDGDFSFGTEDYEELKRVRETLSFLFGSSDLLSFVEGKEPERFESEDGSLMQDDEILNAAYEFECKVESFPEESKNEFEEKIYSPVEEKMETFPLAIEKKLKKSTRRPPKHRMKTRSQKDGTFRRRLARPKKRTKKSSAPKQKRPPSEQPSKTYQLLLEDREKISSGPLGFRDYRKPGLTGERKVHQVNEMCWTDGEDENVTKYKMNSEECTEDQDDTEELFLQTTTSSPQSENRHVHEKNSVQDDDDDDDFYPRKRKVNIVTVFDEWDQRVCDEMLVHETSDKTIATLKVLPRCTTDFQWQSKVFTKSDTERNEDSRFKCPHCRSTIEGWNHYIHHVLGHDTKGMHPCGICPTYFEGRGPRFQHWIDHFRCKLTGTMADEVISCNLCGKEFFTSSTKRRLTGKKLSHHFLMHDAAIDPCVACGFLPEFQGRKFRNQECEKYAKKVKDGVASVSTRQPDVLKILCDRIQKHKKDMGPHHDGGCAYLDCDGIKFSSWREHLEHVDVHHEGCFKWKCGFCEQLFDNEIAFDCHFQLLHKQFTENSDHACHHCGKCFTSSANLARHVQDQHQASRAEQVEPVICDICGRSYLNFEKLKSHLQIHKYDNYSLSCGQCGKTFTNRTAKAKLKAHILLTHTPDDQKPFECKFCGKRFTNPKTMRVHVAIHENKREHQCRFCGQGFNDKRNMYAHEKKNCSKRF